MKDSQDLKPLYARLDDLRARAQRGEVGMSDFLSPRECRIAEEYLRRAGVHFVCFGGYESAERKRIYILPDYMETAEDAYALSDFGCETGIVALCMTPSGYRSLSHRDYLGSVLGLGIERDVIGDILVSDDSSATVFCDSAIKEFLLSELVWVSRDKVKVREADIGSLVLPQREYLPINDTVASPRLDCVVGALCSLSRESAKQAVLSGLVELDFLPEERPDRLVDEGTLLSVRGYGRYRVLSLSEKTKKGRYRLCAEKFV